MAKFKKNFWTGSMKMEDGRVVDTPEPEWYARQQDPIDRLGGYKGVDNPRPEGARIPQALVGSKIVTVKEAFEIYKVNNTESFRLPFEQFKISLINGTKFKTTKGVISKP